MFFSHQVQFTHLLILVRLTSYEWNCQQCVECRMFQWTMILELDEVVYESKKWLNWQCQFDPPIAKQLSLELSTVHSRSFPPRTQPPPLKLDFLLEFQLAWKLRSHSQLCSFDKHKLGATLVENKGSKSSFNCGVAAAGFVDQTPTSCGLSSPMPRNLDPTL